MLIIENSRHRASKNESCYQCGKTIRKGTSYFQTEQFSHSGHNMCSQNCLREYSAPIQDSIPTFEKSLLGRTFGLVKKKVTNSGKNNKEEDIKTNQTLTRKTVAGVGKIASKGLSSINSTLEKIDERSIKKKDKIRARAKEISVFSFSDNPVVLKNEIEELITLRSQLDSEEMPIKKAIYKKLEFGIQRLSLLGENTNFYEEKMNEIKPNIWENISYYFSSD